MRQLQRLKPLSSALVVDAAAIEIEVVATLEKCSVIMRINSRVAIGFTLHSDYPRDRMSLGLKVTRSIIVMMAKANFAMKLNSTEQNRELVLSLVA